MSQYFNKKVVLLGDSAVGKSSLCIRHIKKEFEQYAEPTIGAAFLTSIMNVDDVDHRLEIWDTAGQERYRSLAPMYYRGAVAALVVYDVTKDDSYQGAKRWCEELLSRGREDIIIILVGNKYDLLEESEQNNTKYLDYVNRHDGRVIHIYTSSKTGYNVDRAFELAASESHKMMLKHGTLCTAENRVVSQQPIVTVNYRKRRKSGCC